jgi:thiol:disulfide interchange protein DsbD
MLKFFRTLLALVGLWPAASLLAQEAPNGEQLTQRALLADTAAVEAGKPFYAGFHFKIADTWHTYWQIPGSVGFPFKVTWTLPDGWQAGPVEFPLPVIAADAYGSTFYAYEHEVVFLVKITPPAQLPAGEVKLGAKFKWQVCQETCIMGNDALELKLPTGTAKPANAELFTKWLAQLPKTTPPPTKDVKFEAKEKMLTVRIAGLPAEAKAEFFPVPPESFTGTLEIGEKLTSKVDGGVAVLTFPYDGPVPAEGWSGLLVVKKGDGPREGWMLGAAGAGAPAPSATPPKSAAGGSALDPFAGVKADDGTSYAVLLLFGFLGGLILNLMPCVLPVIGLKILGFIEQSGNSRRRIFQLGLAFCAGVFAFFYTLAIVTIPLKSAGVTLSVGWQFQQPYLLVGMLALFLAFALNLLGVFELELSGNVSSKLSDAARHEGLGGAFVHGFFTTLMGFSCTAPFAAQSLGAAFAQPGPRAFGLFTMISAGLCLPYFLLTLQPAWMRFLPKPGTWMIRFKQVMGFVLLGFVVFFFDAMVSRGSEAVSATLYFLLVVAFACWLLGIFQENRWRWPLAAALVLIAWLGVVRGAYRPVQTDGAAAQAVSGWEPYSGKRLTEALQAGKPVFVDFTADWCLNCKFYEKTVLATTAVQDALKKKGVVLLKGDVTHEDSPAGREATEALAKFGRAGVPFYVLFRKAGDVWSSESLSQDGLLSELNKL